MPRQRRSAAAPSRPTVATRQVLPPPQSRSATTAAHRPQAAAPQAAPQASQGSGLFGQMASTAAGVAVGSSIGHALGGFFGGGSSPAAEAPVDSALQSQQSYQQNGLARSCENDARAFTRCLDENQNEHAMSVCGWYMEQLKACQQAASQYSG